MNSCAFARLAIFASSILKSRAVTEREREREKERERERERRQIRIRIAFIRQVDERVVLQGICCGSWCIHTTLPRTRQKHNINMSMNEYEYEWILQYRMFSATGYGNY